MAESDYLSEGNVYTTFSKGPKSIYRWRDEVNLPALILNVPQKDEDDEWGRTQRIADERVLDYIAKIYYTLFDNQGSINSISLSPGEAGADINVAKNMIRLIGRASTSDTGVFDLSVPNFTLGDVIIDGSANTINIGTSTQMTSNSLTLDSNVIFSSTTSTSIYQYKDKNVLRFTNNGTDPAYTEIIINGKSYRFDETGLTLPSGSTISGTIKSNNIAPISNNTYNIGTSSLRYANIYGVNGDFSGTITAGAVTTASLGKSGSLVTVCGTSIVMLLDDAYTLSFQDRDLIPGLNNVSSLGTSSYRFSDIFAVDGNFSGTLTTRDIVPVANITSDIGTSLLRYKAIYGNTGVFNDHVKSPHICSNGAISFYGVGFDFYDDLNYIFRVSSDVITYKDILPNADDTQDLGSLSLRFSKIYARTVYADYMSASSLGAPGENVTICGGGYVSLYSVDTGYTVNINSEGFVPGSNADVNLGSSSYNWNKVYATTVYADYMNASSLGDPGENVIICGGGYVSLYSVDAGKAIRIDGSGFRPDSSGDVSLGSSSTPFKELWVEDETTGSPVRIYVSNGVLYP